MNPLGKLDRWRLWLAPGSGFVTMVADDSGTPVGHTTVSGNELVHLYVDPDHWGRGLGRRLLQVGEDLLRKSGRSDVELSTMVGNERAIALYRSAGWTLTDRLVHNDQDRASCTTNTSSSNTWAEDATAHILPIRRVRVGRGIGSRSPGKVLVIAPFVLA